jgi:hypothetical protein
MNALVGIQHWLYSGMASGLGDVAGGEPRAILAAMAEGLRRRSLEGSFTLLGDVDFLVRPTGGHQKQGGGVASTLDRVSHGQCLISLLGPIPLHKHKETGLGAK